MKEREREREKLVSFEHKSHTWLCVGHQLGGMCMCVCVYCIGPRRKWTQGMVKRFDSRKSYTNKCISRILGVCVWESFMPQLFDPKCSDKAYVPAIYIAYKQRCLHLYKYTHTSAYGAYVLWTCARLVV